MDDKSSILNVDGPSVLKIELHVPRRELERKFEIVLFAENARMELKSSVVELTDPCIVEPNSSSNEGTVAH